MSSLSNPIISYCLTPVKLAACGLALFTTPVVNTAPLITPGHLLLGQIKHYVQCAFATYSSACNGRSRELNHHNWMMCPSNTRPVYLTPDPNRYPTLWDQGSSLVKRWLGQSPLLTWPQIPTGWKLLLNSKHLKGSGLKGVALCWVSTTTPLNRPSKTYQLVVGQFNRTLAFLHCLDLTSYII